MSNVMEFGFDDAKIIKASGIERWKQDRPNHTDRISLIAFKTFHEVLLRQKALENGKPLNDAEKAEICQKIDAKLAESLGKEPDELTEIEKLDIKSPRFSVAYTHFSDGVGSIRCLSQWEGTTCAKMAQCCKEIGDPSQHIAIPIVKYPIDQHAQVEEQMLKDKKYTEILIWRMTSKKFKKLEAVYVEARNDGKPVPDLKVTLDGDPQYQKQVIVPSSTAFWAREGGDPGIRQWILEQGLRAMKSVPNHLGYEMSAEKLAEKLGGQAASTAALNAAPETSAAAPKLQASYDDLLS